MEKLAIVANQYCNSDRLKQKNRFAHEGLKNHRLRIVESHSQTVLGKYK